MLEECLKKYFQIGFGGMFLYSFLSVYSLSRNTNVWLVPK